MGGLILEQMRKGEAKPIRPDELAVLAQVPDDTRLGPAMTALSERHRVFVRALMVEGDATAAAEAAGYKADNRAALRAAGHRLSHDEGIQKALAEELPRALRVLAPTAFNVVKGILEDPKTPARDRLKAAELIASRVIPAEQRITVTHEDSFEVQAARVYDSMRQAGICPHTHLGTLADDIAKERGDKLDFPNCPRCQAREAIDVEPIEHTPAERRDLLVHQLHGAANGL